MVAEARYLSTDRQSEPIANGMERGWVGIWARRGRMGGCGRLPTARPAEYPPLDHLNPRQTPA
jgi:hypothetical protein